LRRVLGSWRGAPAATGTLYPVLFFLGAGLILAGFGAGLWRTISAERRPPGLQQQPLADAERWLERRQPERAAREYRHAAQLNPGDLSVLVHAGLGLTRAGDEPGGVVLLQNAQRLSPRSASPLLALGGVRYRQSRFAEAQRAYDQALRLEPLNAVAYADRGELWLEQNRFLEAREDLARSLQLEPGRAEVHNSLGIALALSGRQAEAVEHFSAAVRLKPGGGFEANLERARAQGTPSAASIDP
jgi:Flp pilus assembly protein TadD